MNRVVIVGGGITGLATALHLQDRADRVSDGLEVVVLERRDDPGGNLRTEHRDGYIVEAGPNGFLDNAPRTLELVRRLGLEDRLQPAADAAGRRFIFRHGRLNEVPMGAGSFIRSGILSPRGRLRLFGEPFARRRPDGVDETVWEFAARRIGAEAASYLVDAMVSGVFAGNARELSLRSAFPRMAAMEAEHGSLVRAMVARMLERRTARREVEARRARGEPVAELTRPGGPAGPGGTLTSFTGGLADLVGALAGAVGGALRRSSHVTAVERSDGDRPWRVRLAPDHAIEADVVVVATPSPVAAPLLEPVDAELSATVAAIPTAGLAVVALGYRLADLDGVDLDGFGFLVPRQTGPRILGCLWDSSYFPGRAPAGHALLRCMIGGAHDPEAVSLPDATLLGEVRRDLETTMGVRAEPEMTGIYRWPLGIGQYTVGHQDRLDRIHARLAEHPGLLVAGSSFYGISMNACFEHAPDQADAIVAYLNG